MMTQKIHDSYTLGDIKYTVKGFSVLVEIEAVPASTSTIVIPGEEQEREKYLAARHTGFVRAIGSLAWDDEGEPRAKVGDKVLFASYAGRDVNRTIENRLRKDQPLLRAMTDKEIICVIEDTKPEEQENV